MQAIVLPRFRAPSCAPVLVFLLLIPAIASAGLARRFPEQCQLTPGTAGTEIFLTGDVNGDGKVDILSGTRNPASYFLSLGNGDGTFSPQIPVTLDAGVYSLVLADVDGDGRADAVVTNYSKDSVREYPGLASGGFGPARLLISYSRPAGLAVADLNGDGRLDLVVTTYLDAKLRTYFQASDGTFTPVSVVPSLSSPSVLVLADMDGDHQPDAVLLTGDVPAARVRIYRGSVDGTFSPLSTVDANGTGVSVGDFNGDGIKDLAVWGYQNDALIVFLGTGGGALDSGTHLLGYSFIRGAAVGDWTGDGIDDLILSRDQGSTASSALYLFPGSGNGISGSNQPVPAPITSSNTVSADFDGDGRMDVAGASTIGISVTEGRPNGGFGSVYEIALPGDTQDISLGDVLGNGHADLALQIAAPPGTVYRIYRSFTDQSLQQSAEVSRSKSGAGILLDDMNGDGRADLIGLTDGPGTLSTYLSGPNGSLAAPSDLALSGPSPSAFGVGRIDLATNSPDVVYVQPNYSNNYGFIGGLLNEGDGTFQSGFVTMSPEGPTKMALDDIDLTHPYLDALAISAGGDLVLFRGTGGTRFEWPAPLGYRGDRAGIVLGDLNGDGHVDVLTWPASGNSISMFRGGGDGTFAAPVSLPTVAGISGLAVGDIDGNGTLDVVVTHGNRNSVAILYGKGDGSFSAEDEYIVDPNTALPRVGDIDGDGRADIVLASSSNALVDVLFQRASAVAVEPSGPKSFGLQLASANPARGSITFRASLPGSGSARLGIFDLRGRLVREYTDLRRAESVRWDGRFATGEHAAAGVYFARLRLDKSEATAKFVWMN